MQAKFTPGRRAMIRGLTIMAVSVSSVTPVLAAPGITADRIVLGQSVALTGPLGELGKEVTSGAQAYFKALNARGGIQGRKVELRVQDDGYDPKKTADINAGWQNQVFAFFSPFGTGPSEAILPLAQKARIPVLTPYTGSSTVRQPSNTITVNLRASYEDETRQIIKHLMPLGLGRVAVLYQDASFGREVLRAATSALSASKLAPAASAAVKADSSNVGEAVSSIAGSKPLSVIVGVVGKPAVDTIRALRKSLPGVHIYTLSVFSNNANFAALGKDGVGVTITQVMPFPSSTTVPLLRKYRTDMLAAGFNEKQLSHPSLEGYINAALFAEAMGRAGKDPTREGFMQAIYGMRNVSIDGYPVRFQAANAESASRTVTMTFISSAGILSR